ncbi:MAG TPA: glycosyltransferase family 2 protein [Propionibacteriaceae bacterium]|nr:glycosyltransferase family 2 protein [Propionibacteriaceae bacterium]
MAAPSRRGSEAWARPAAPAAPTVEVLIPTYRRPTELAVTLAGLAAQDDPPFAVVISDQSEGDPPWEVPAVASMVRVLEAQGRPVTVLRHRPRRGLAEHRQFLLDQATSGAVLFLDDDVWLEPGTLARMSEALEVLQCGFVGSAVQGLSFLPDDRPAERTAYAPWTDGVRPERVRRDTDGFARWPLHNAANLTHLAAGLDLSPGEWQAYRVAWVGGCVLFRRSALVESGGFTFEPELEPDHSGEDVAAQWRVMERFGGAGILPSGAVHLEAPTTMPNRTVDVFDLMVEAERTG